MKTTAPPPVPADAKPKKRSSVRHIRAIQRDRRQRPTSAPPAAAVAERLTEIVHPATLTQVGLFHVLGLRARVLTVPVMMGLVLGMLWRQIGRGGAGAGGSARNPAVGPSVADPDAAAALAQLARWPVRAGAHKIASSGWAVTRLVSWCA